MVSVGLRGADDVSLAPGSDFWFLVLNGGAQPEARTAKPKTKNLWNLILF
jgi:hypothetical protein